MNEKFQNSGFEVVPGHLEKTKSFRRLKTQLNRYLPVFIPLNENRGSEVDFRENAWIMCGSNNYLGMTTHPKVREAAIKALQRSHLLYRSRFLNGTLAMHEQLEHDSLNGPAREAALVFSTGMQTNLGTVSALVSRDDVVILDKEDLRQHR